MSLIDNEEPLGMIKFEENDKCHFEDGCKYDFFKELTSPYDVENMQEFIAVIRADAIDECIQIVKNYSSALVGTYYYNLFIDKMEQLKEQK
ncbi:MAG: hypothetical protein KBT03_04815 [Bacteroidales bacterium]|nr:hypothetical protein [Candidatus Scybalousia scybalohippi]